MRPVQAELINCHISGDKELDDDVLVFLMTFPTQ